MARPKGLAGILGSALIAVLCAADLFQLVWKFRAVRWVFEALNLGGAVDFIIQHTNNPGWVGNMLTPLGDPIVQIFLIALGLALIYFDNRRRTGNRNLDPRLPFCRCRLPSNIMESNWAPAVPPI